MSIRIDKTIKRTLAERGIRVVRSAVLEQLQLDRRSAEMDLEFLRALDQQLVAPALGALAGSRSQLRQDVFALSQLGFKRRGYFVEVGAASGVDLSNTYLLETEFGWTGILAEPALCWHASLRANRSAIVDTDCVWRTTGETLEFTEVTGAAELSTIRDFASCDRHGKSRSQGETYPVATVSLNDLLTRHGAPRSIDYLSLDTEGSEYQILSAVDFDVYDFAVITVEHNYTDNQTRIHELLAAKGYRRQFEQISAFDDWYVRV